MTPVPEDQLWRLPFMHKLLSARQEAFYGINDNEEAKLMELIESLDKK